jgi:hypothetical protein
VSGDISPQPGSRLHLQHRPAGVRRTPAPPPSLLHVFATTLRLWLRRRVLRLPDGAKLGALRWAVVAVVAVLAIAGAAGGAVALRTAAQPQPRPAHHHALRPRITPAQVQAMANERSAAAWIAAQLAAGTGVACDPAMCADLQAAGWPAGHLQTLTPGGALPGGVVLVVSPAVLQSASAGQAGRPPELIASFGSGQESVHVLAGSGTPEQFRAAARAAVAAAHRLGSLLAHEPQVHASGSAGRWLVSGLVDRRLLVVLHRLALIRPLYVAGFGGAAPGAGWPGELRAMTLARLNPGVGPRRDLGAVLRALRGLPARYRPAVREAHGPGGAIQLHLEFPAPSPV